MLSIIREEFIASALIIYYTYLRVVRRQSARVALSNPLLKRWESYLR